MKYLWKRGKLFITWQTHKIFRIFSSLCNSASQTISRKWQNILCVMSRMCHVTPDVFRFSLLFLHTSQKWVHKTCLYLHHFIKIKSHSYHNHDKIFLLSRYTYVTCIRKSFVFSNYYANLHGKISFSVSKMTKYSRVSRKICVS